MPSGMQLLRPPHRFELSMHLPPLCPGLTSWDRTFHQGNHSTTRMPIRRRISRPVPLIQQQPLSILIRPELLPRSCCSLHRTWQRRSEHHTTTCTCHATTASLTCLPNVLVRVFCLTCERQTIRPDLTDSKRTASQRTILTIRSCSTSQLSGPSRLGRAHQPRPRPTHDVHHAPSTVSHTPRPTVRRTHSRLVRRIPRSHARPSTTQSRSPARTRGPAQHTTRRVCRRLPE